jgi:hypothetical protein
MTTNMFIHYLNIILLMDCILFLDENTVVYSMRSVSKSFP